MNLPVARVRDVLYPRLRAPDLDCMEAFLDDFGLELAKPRGGLALDPFGILDVIDDRDQLLRGERLLESVELDQDRALLDARFVGLRGRTTCEKTAARRLYRRTRKLRVCGDGCRIGNRTIETDEVTLGHHDSFAVSRRGFPLP